MAIIAYYVFLSIPPFSLPNVSDSDARNMARDVQNTLLSIIKQHGRKTDSEASEYVKKLQKRGHYLQDVWF